MTYTLEDAERETGEEQLIAQILEAQRDIVIAGFVEGRLTSYFEEHPDLSKPAVNALAEARRMLEISPSAALVFAFSSIEMTIQDVLLKPVVAGLTHNPDLSDVLAELIDVRNKKTEALLFSIMQHIGVPNFKDQPLVNGRVAWKEKIELQELRNLVVHRGASASKEQAERALVLSEYLLLNVFRKIREYFTNRSAGRV
ncbi:hypothetical protein [Plastoroseomonas hellenica]|uniref:hypothetical protein n=1 Tax=Plastoroseomonas hellenica TaxID=2687306 RepID=UPI001BA4656E|nr:hypothetical protein [Plastoroseomonas hellenica]MBR0644144.1 hypothetical protein [Plastoroseomonas hellenica]